MERRLQEAALTGSVTSLILLLQEDELILDRAMVAFATNTPLHVALKLGHVDFAKEILNRKPGMGIESDERRSSPLHLASAKGYTEIVRELLVIDADICVARDQDGRTPLHLAAIKGQVEVMKELVQVRPITTRILLDRGETILHLCVKHNRLEALKLLVDSMGDVAFVNWKDDDGNTVLHLAVADKQTETIKFLVGSTGVEVNALNANGLTAFDVLPQSPRDVREVEIGGLLRGAGALRARDIPSGAIRDRVSFSETPESQGSSGEKQFKNQNQEEWLKKKQNALMVVASLIATMAFQAGLYPPGGVWQDEAAVSSQAHRGHIAGFAIWADHHPTRYPQFLRVNTISFIASLSIILLLISGLPLKNRIFMWILIVIMWVAITSIAIVCLLSVMALIPVHFRGRVSVFIVGYTLLTWLGLIVLLLLGKSGLLKRSRRGQLTPTNENHINI